MPRQYPRAPLATTELVMIESIDEEGRVVWERVVRPTALEGVTRIPTSKRRATTAA